MKNEQAHGELRMVVEYQNQKIVTRIPRRVLQGLLDDPTSETPGKLLRTSVAEINRMAA